jgi:hypothetical protein
MISPDADGRAGPPPDAAEALPDVERRLAAFYERIEACFGEAAAAGGGPIVVDYRIAGQPVRLRFAHHRLRALVGRAFEHLAVSTAGPDPAFTMSLWDSRASGVAMPRPPWSLRDYTQRGEIRGYGTRRFRTSFHLHSGIFNMADLAAGRAVYWVRDAAAVPSYASSMPLLPILHWWTAQFGMQLVHGGVVGTVRAAALLAGQGGAGKSTTALACLGAGLDYVGDDYCLIQPDPAPRAHSVFCSARLHPPGLERLPFLRPLVSNPSDLASDKALVFLRDAFPARLAAELPVRVVLLPRVASQRATTSEPAPRAAAHRALTTVTLHNLPGAGAAAIETIARTVRQLPCYYLNLGSDRETLPAAIRAILEGTT